MSDCSILLSTSFKGGVGKSTLAANLAYYLARAGSKTLLCDLDLGVRSLDLIMGYEDKMVFDILDVVSGRMKPEEAWICDTRCEGLYFLGAPYNVRDELEPKSFSECIRRIGEEYDFDHIILDTPGAETDSLICAANAADIALIVANHTPTSVRGAVKSAELVEKYGVEPYLVVNSFDPDSVLDGRRDGMLELIDSTRLPLIGVIPYDRALVYAQEKGILSVGKKFISAKAFENTAQRLTAMKKAQRPVPILKGVIKKKRKKLLTK